MTTLLTLAETRLENLGELESVVGNKFVSKKAIPGSNDAEYLSVFAADLLKTGEDFLTAISKRITEHLEADLVVIGSLRVAEAERMFVRALETRTPHNDMVSYDICSAPCQDVVARKAAVVIREDLQELYPEDPGIKLFGSRSYVGAPLYDENRDCAGIFLMEWCRKISRNEAQQALEILNGLEPRVSRELAQLQLTDSMDAMLATSIEPAHDEKTVLRTLTLQAAESMQVKMAFLAECIDDDPQHFRLLSVVVDGDVVETAEGVVLPYSITPCEKLKENDTFLLKQGLQADYPDDKDFKRLGLQSYYGIAFKNASGHRIGHLALLHERPMTSRVTESKLLKSLSSRARQELLRRDAARETRGLEDALIVRQKLESLGLLAGTIAHDFNNHLAAVIGHTELALHELDEAPTVREHLEIAEESMWSARDVIQQLMEFAGDKALSEPDIVPINVCVERVLSMMNVSLHARYSVQTDLASELPLIEAVPAHLEQIVVNLILNASDAFDERHGVLKIKTKLVELSRQEHNRCVTGNGPKAGTQCVLLEISDNGSGMDASTIARAFDPFFSTKTSGRGLGLAGVLGLTRRMNACLTVESEPKIGTRFRLYFAGGALMPEVDDKEASAMIGQPLEQKKGLILIVDDQEAILNVVTKQVEAMGYEVVQAPSGVDAAQALSARPDIQAILMDVSMPELDGWGALEGLRAIQPNIPAIMMSGNHSSESSDHQARLGGVQLIHKPFSLVELQSELEVLFNNL